MVLVIGTLIYNEIVVVPIDVCSRNTKENIELEKDGLRNFSSIMNLKGGPTSLKSKDRISLLS